MQKKIQKYAQNKTQQNAPNKTQKMHKTKVYSSLRDRPGGKRGGGVQGFLPTEEGGRGVLKFSGSLVPQGGASSAWPE